MQDLASQRFALPAGSLLKIRANPKIEAQEALANLTNKAAPAMQKKAVFDLAKTQLTVRDDPARTRAPYVGVSTNREQPSLA